MLNLFETTFIIFLIQYTILYCIWNKLLMHVIGIVICTMIRFLLMYSKQFLSQYNHSKREYGFIYFYLCLLLSQEIASFCFTAQILLRMWSVLWSKFTLLNAHLYILVHICWNCIYNHCTIQFWLQKNFFFQYRIRNKMIQSWNSCNHQFMNW